jgi:hypothetical protein
MTKRTPLSQIKIASPCTASWDAMTGDEQVRFCGQCSKYVYNFSAMTERQAETLISEQEGKMCIRFYRRSDGTMLTTDCPVGWGAIKRRAALLGGAGVAILAATFGVFMVGALGSSAGNGNRRVQAINPVQRVRDWLFPPPACVMGEAPPIPKGVAPPQAAN